MLRTLHRTDLMPLVFVQSRMPSLQSGKNGKSSDGSSVHEYQEKNYQGVNSGVNREIVEKISSYLTKNNKFEKKEIQMERVRI